MTEVVIMTSVGGLLADATSDGTDGIPIWSRIFFITSVLLIVVGLFTGFK
jgi:hypothetical protein